MLDNKLPILCLERVWINTFSKIKATSYKIRNIEKVALEKTFVKPGFPKIALF
jgi:hypothetical protein